MTTLLNLAEEHINICDFTINNINEFIKEKRDRVGDLIKIILNINLSVGVEELDIQHQLLFNVLLTMLEMIKNKKTDKEKIEKGMSILIEYTESHFEYEEHLMEKYNYINIDRHKKEHKLLKNKVLLFSKSCPKIPINCVVLAEFLLDWMDSHILKEDKFLAKSLNENGMF